MTGRTQVVEIDESGARRDYHLTPEEFGIARYPIESLRGGTPADNARLAMELLRGEGSAGMRDAVLLNAGAALYLAGAARNIGEGFRLAREALRSGRAAEKLAQIQGHGKAREAAA